MSGKGRNQRYIFKVHSSRLKRGGWNINLKLRDARASGELVGIGESQILRWFDELNGIEDCEIKINEIKAQIEDYRKQIRTDESVRPVLKSLYQQLDHYTFKPDYVTVVIDKVADYRKIYKNGFVINGIRFRRLLGTSSGIKLNTIVFVNEKWLSEIKKRIANGRNMEKEFVPAKLEAYQALVCSSSIPVSMPKGVVCVPDCFTHFKADVIELDDSEDGEPKMTFVKDKECELCDSDGYGLGMPELLAKWGKDIGEDYLLSGCVIRNAFCKGTIYPIDFRQFAYNNNLSEIIDSWGVSHNVEEVELVLTESMLKLWDSYSSIDEYLRSCKENHYSFCITKAAECELENVRNMNYQFLQSYDFSDEDIEKLIEPTVLEIKDVLLNDYRKTICYSKGVNLSYENITNSISPDFATALMIEPSLINDKYVQNQLQGMISKRINDAKKGVLKVDGCYTLVCGDPYSLCQSMFGLEVTGLLKAGEVYSKYWIDKGIDEVVMFRAPMLDMNNVRRVRIVHNKQMDDFYKYVTIPVLLNSWDMIAEAMSGSDKDGDCFIITNNEVLLRNTKDLPPIQCLQRKAEKSIPIDDILFDSNINSFGNQVGAVTNRSTSMFEVRARFPNDSEEYKILSYRIKCIQQAQQNEIDKAKGIKAKPLPKYWVDFFATKPDENDDEETRKWKEFQRSIVADRKPYFFRYVYPTENTKWLKYEKDSNFKALMQFGCELGELKQKKELSNEEKVFMDNYYSRLPLGIAPCTINRICWKIENEFDGKPLKSIGDFDYSLLKNDNVEYDYKICKQIKRLYKEYLRERHELDATNHSIKIDSEEYSQMVQQLNASFKRDCTLICPSKVELCNILLDICYENSLVSKRFVWEMCSDVIVENLLERHNYTFEFPVQDDNGDFEFGGIKFFMKLVNLKK